MIRIVASFALCVTGVVCAQSEPHQQFEVASIKASKDPTSSSSGLNTGNGRLTASNVTLKRCIMGAFAVGPNQIFGGPDWLASDRFEITAKAEQPVGDHILMAMLQTLLTDRFKLAIHREAKPIQGNNILGNSSLTVLRWPNDKGSNVDRDFRRRSSSDLLAVVGIGYYSEYRSKI